MTSLRSALRGLIIGLLGGVVVVVVLMWSAGDLELWQTRSGSIALTILLFAFSGIIGGLFMGRSSS